MAKITSRKGWPHPESRLLILHQGALGDFVAIFPAIIRLRRYFNQIDVICQHQSVLLAKALGLAEKGFALESAALASLFSPQVDTKLCDLLKSYAKIVLFTFSGQLEQSLNQITSNRCIRIAPRPAEDKRVPILAFVIQNLINRGLLEKTDQDLEKILPPAIQTDPAAPSGDRSRILIHPGSGSIRKRWPISQFIQIESMLKSGDMRPEFILGPVESDLRGRLQDANGENRKIHIIDDILEFLALLKAGGGYIGNDSGASHLAAYMGLPTVVVFGPADPRRWRPFGPRVKIVRPRLACQPCFETDQNNCDHPRCLDETTPQTVVDAFYSVYEGR